MSDRQGPSFVNWMGSLWGYTILRFGMFFALWGLLVLVGLGGLLAPLIALVLSIPLSLVLLAGPRARVANNIEHRIEASREARTKLDKRLDPKQDDEDLAAKQCGDLGDGLARAGHMPAMPVRLDDLGDAARRSHKSGAGIPVPRQAVVLDVGTQPS